MQNLHSTPDLVVGTFSLGHEESIGVYAGRENMTDQKPGLEAEHLCTDLRKAVLCCSPSNMNETERVLLL